VRASAFIGSGGSHAWRFNLKRDQIDFFEIRPAHAEIHRRLLNWARWVRPMGYRGSVLSMFRHYRNGYEESHPSAEIDSLDGANVEKAVQALPPSHREAIRWWYVRNYIPVHRMRKALGLTTPALHELVHDARAMLRNRG
jgi:DNA-directed RNA polymerase specialized sigma24 family protein